MKNRFTLCFFKIRAIFIIYFMVGCAILVLPASIKQIYTTWENDSTSQPTSNRIVSVVDYGAKGNGRQDDSPAIQKALDSGAEVITIPPGIYNIKNTLWVSSNITLKADAQAIIRLANGAGNNVNIFLLANRNFGNGNSNITVEGGIWDGNNINNHRGKDGDLYGYTGTAINFINVKNLIIKDLVVRNPDAFSIRVGEVEDFLIENIVLDHSVIRPNQDGIHIGGFSQRGKIRQIRAIYPNTPNDDMIAINADDDVERVINLRMRRGPIRNIIVEDIQSDGAYNFVRILSNESLIENIIVRRIKGSCRFYAINMSNWSFPVGSGNISNIRFEQFNVVKTVNTDWAQGLIQINLKVSNLYICNFIRGDNSNTVQAATLFLNNGLDNTICYNDRVQQYQSNFFIPQGGIHELWINRSDSNLIHK